MIKHIVTLGFGPGASGVAFVPTLGFTPGAVVVVADPRVIPLRGRADTPVLRGRADTPTLRGRT